MFNKMSKLSIKRITEAMVMAAVMSGSVYGYAAPAATELPNLKEIVSGIDGQITTKTEKIGGVDHATMTINQAANANVARIDWNTFNIGSNATVNVKQAVSSQTLINNVVGNKMSEIYGKINATGNIVLINPKGVVFGGNSEVNVGGLSVYATGVEFDGDNFKVNPNNALQGNITVKDNAKIHVGIGYAISQLSNLGFKADGSDYFIGRVNYDSNDNKLRLVAAGDVNIESTANSAPRLVATGHVSNTGEHAEGEEQFILEGAGSGSHSGIILRADADADDWGTVKINNQDVNNKAKIAGNLTVYYNPASAVEGVADSRAEQGTSGVVAQYNKKDFANGQTDYSNLFGTLTKAELEAENETAIANSSVHVMAGDSLKKAKEAGNVGALTKIEDGQKQLMLVNNINQLQDIEAAGTGNLAGDYALGRDINGTNDGTSVIKDGVIYVKTKDGVTVKSTDGFYVDADGKATGVAANIVGKEGTDRNVNYVVKSDVSTASKTNEAGNINVNYSYTTGAEDIAVTGTIKEGQNNYTANANAQTLTDGASTYSNANHTLQAGQTTYAYADGKVSAGDFSANATTISKGDYSYSGTQGAYKQGEKDVLVDATNVTIDNNTYTYNSETPGIIKINNVEYAISSEEGAAALATFNAVQTGVAGLADNYNTFTGAFNTYNKFANTYNQFSEVAADSAAVKTLLASEAAQYVAEKTAMTNPATVKLGMVNASKWDNGKGFNPIGTSNTAAFSGYFTGDDGVKVHDIVDLTIDRPQEDNVGLFSTLSGEVWRLQELGPQITGKNNVGAVAGELTGKITNAGVTGAGINGAATTTADFVKGQDNVGGLVGKASGNATIGSAGNSATIVGNDNVGGIVGNAEKAAMANVVNRGNVFGVDNTAADPSTNVGGLVGSMKEGTIAGSNFSPAFNNGQISGTENVGGLVGYVNGNSVVIKDAFNTNESDVLNGSSQIWVGADGKVDSIGGGYEVKPVMEDGHYKIQTWDGKELAWDSDLKKFSAQQVKGRYMLVDNNGNPVYYEIKDPVTHETSKEAIYVKQQYDWKDGDTTKADNYISDTAMLSKYGKVTGNTNVGGLVGKMDAGTVERSYNAGNITGTANSENIGGIVGNLAGGTVLSVYNADNNTVIREKREANDIPQVVRNAKVTRPVLGTDEQQTYMYNAVDSEYNSFFTVDASGNRTYYYFLPNNGQLAKGAQGVYVNAAGQYVENIDTVVPEATRFYFNRVAYKDANVTGTANVGGIAGAMTGNATIANSYNAGTVSGSSKQSPKTTGALVGAAEDVTKVTDSFFVTGKNMGIKTSATTCGTDFSGVETPFGSNTKKVNVKDAPLDGVKTYTHEKGKKETPLSIYSGSFNTMTSETTLRGMKTGAASEWMSETNNISDNTQDGQADKHTWITYKYTTLPLLYNLMKDDTIQRTFTYDGTTHNLKTNDVENIYGMANFDNAWDGRNVIGTNKYGLSADPNSDADAHSIYTYNSTSMWSPQHAYRTSEAATLEILPNDITVTIEGERTYGQHHLQGYYVVVPGFKTLVDGKIVTDDKYYKVAGDTTIKTHVEMTADDFAALGLSGNFTVAQFKQAAYKSGNYSVTVNGLVAGESVDGVLRGWLANKVSGQEGNFVYDGRNDVITKDVRYDAATGEVKKYSLKAADYSGFQNTQDGITNPYYLLDDIKTKRNPITVADNNNYNFGYKGSLKINKADLLYTYEGVKEYGQDDNVATSGKLTIVGVDENTNNESANGLLKSFDFGKGEGKVSDLTITDADLLKNNTVLAAIDGVTVTNAVNDGDYVTYTLEDERSNVQTVKVNVKTGEYAGVGGSATTFVQQVINPDKGTGIYHVKVKDGTTEGTKVVDNYQVLWTNITADQSKSGLVDTLKNNYNFVFAGEGTHTMATTKADDTNPTLTAKPYLTNTTTLAGKSTQTITPKQLSVLVQTDRTYGDLMSTENLRVNGDIVRKGEQRTCDWNIKVDTEGDYAVTSFDKAKNIVDPTKVLAELNQVEDRVGNDQSKIGADTWVKHGVNEKGEITDIAYKLDKNSTDPSVEGHEQQKRGSSVLKDIDGSTVDFTDYYEGSGQDTVFKADNDEENARNIISQNNKYDYVVVYNDSEDSKGHYLNIRRAGVDVRIIGTKTYGEVTSNGIDTYGENTDGVSGHYVDNAGNVTDIMYQYEIRGLKNDENIGGVTNNVEQATWFDADHRSYQIDLSAKDPKTGLSNKESKTIAVRINGKDYENQFLDSDGGDIQRDGNVINLVNGHVANGDGNFVIEFGQTTGSSVGFDENNYNFSHQSLLVVDQRKVAVDTSAAREYGAVATSETGLKDLSRTEGAFSDPAAQYTGVIRPADRNAIFVDGTNKFKNDLVTTTDNSFAGLDVKYDADGNITNYLDSRDYDYANNKTADFLTTVVATNDNTKNYEFVQGQDKLTITPKEITIKIDGTRVYGDPTKKENTDYVFGAIDLRDGETLGNYSSLDEMREHFKVSTPNGVQDEDGDVIGGYRDIHVDASDNPYKNVFAIENLEVGDKADKDDIDAFKAGNYKVNYDTSLKVNARPIVIHIDRTQEQGQPIPTNPKDYNIVPSGLVDGENLNHLGDTTVVINGHPYDIGKYDYQTGGTATYTDPSGIITPTDSYIDSLDFKGQIGGGFKPSNYLISYDTELEILPPYDPTGELASGAANRRSMYSIQYLTIHGNGVNNRSLSEAVSNDSTGTYRADSQGK